MVSDKALSFHLLGHIFPGMEGHSRFLVTSICEIFSPDQLLSRRNRIKRTAWRILPHRGPLIRIRSEISEARCICWLLGSSLYPG